ncbi:MAG: AAA family ATPase, partial [Victivallales bacterium]|nr:AAA family ATPase [Victivallales bacterium]
MEKDLTTSIYTFEDLIKGNFLYVDKTEYIWQLVRPAKGMYFLSRPRRFGKSLLLSTLEAIFTGKKELFKGLAIHGKDYKWEMYPVIHLDLANCDSRTPEELHAYLEHLLKASADDLGVELRETGLAVRFENLIRDAARASNAGQVVILVDEYDKPILGNISDQPRCKTILPVLKGFYSSIKKCSSSIRLAMVTGVSKFCHVSLFSELNNLTDITLESQYAGMLGFTENEVRTCFADRLAEAAEANGLTSEKLFQKLLDWYDGYRFSDAETHVCNPVSISSFLQKPYKFTNYWDTTGTPSFLLELMRKQSYDHEAALNRWYGESIFAAYELEKLDITGL